MKIPKITIKFDRLLHQTEKAYLVEIDTLENVFELRSYVGEKLDKLQRCTTDKEALIIQAQMVELVNYELERLATNEKTLQEQLIELGYS